MADDFADIKIRLVSWEEHLDYFAQLDFVRMKEQWAEIGKLADDYAKRAYINVKEDPPIY